MTRPAVDRHIQATYTGAPLDREAYHAPADGTLEPCECGGHFRYDATARCRLRCAHYMRERAAG
jgi:hypothetical protein